MNTIFPFSVIWIPFSAYFFCRASGIRPPMEVPPPPPPPGLFPRHLNLIYLGKEIYAHISGFGYHLQNYKNTPFSGNLPETTRKKYTPFPRKWEHACGPLLHSMGGGGGGGGGRFHVKSVECLQINHSLYSTSTLRKLNQSTFQINEDRVTESLAVPV